MSLDVTLSVVQSTEVFSANVTHNLGRMARAAGIYDFLWRPDEAGVTRAGQLIQPLQEAIADMKANPDTYRAYDSPNGWGSYDNFVPWIERYLKACQQYPDAEIAVSR